jgi:uncharacterized membrane protein YadS
MKDCFKTEDWWAVWIGLGVVVLAALAAVGVDCLGWVVSTRVWIDVRGALGPASTNYGFLPGIACLGLAYLFLTLLLSIGAAFMGRDVRRFSTRFAVVFWISYACWLLGHWAYIAATPNEYARFGIDWSLGLTNEAGFIIALVAGLVLGNFFPGVSGWLKEATRPEWYIKAAIVILGAGLAVKAVERGELFREIMFRGLAAIIEAYLIYWAVVYFIARKFFKFSREWAAPLASGISICGVSAAIATGAAIRARPIVPVMVSSLVVIFSVVELLVLPFAAKQFLHREPLVAGAWMGLAVKTDGAAVASGAITEGLVRAAAQDEGKNYEKGWIEGTTATVKVFIDVFIGIWAFILALIWVYRVDPKPGERVRVVEIWQRFPKFVLGYFLTFLLLLAFASTGRATIAALKSATGEGDIFRQLFFVMTFFTIGLVSNFKKLWEEGIGRLALVYIVSLFGFIIWVGLAISWLFFHGKYPPIGG